MKTPFEIFQDKKRQRKNQIKQNIIKMKPFVAHDIQSSQIILIETFHPDRSLYKNKPNNLIIRRGISSFINSQRQTKSERHKGRQTRYQDKNYTLKKQIRFLKNSFDKKHSQDQQSPKIKQVKSSLAIENYQVAETFASYNQFNEFELQSSSVNLQQSPRKRIHSTTEHFLTITSPNKRSSESGSPTRIQQLFRRLSKQAKKTSNLYCQQMHMKTKEDFVKYYMNEANKQVDEQLIQRPHNEEVMTNFIKVCRKKRVPLPKTQQKSNKIAEMQIMMRKKISSPSKSKRCYPQSISNNLEDFDQPLKGWQNQRQQYPFQIL